MKCGMVTVSFAMPDSDEQSENFFPHISIDLTDLLQELEEADAPGDRARLIQKLQQAETELGIFEMLEETVDDWEPAYRPEVCEYLAEQLERIANDLRNKGEALSKNLRPRSSNGPRV